MASVEKGSGAIKSCAPNSLDATKDDLAAFRTEFEKFREETRESFASLHAGIHDIRHRFDTLEEIARDNAGLTKEIDLFMERVRAIEKHLCIQHKMAASHSKACFSGDRRFTHFSMNKAAFEQKRNILQVSMNSFAR